MANYVDAMITTNQNPVFTLPCDIEYYESPDLSAEPVLILEKGTQFSYYIGLSSDMGYGVVSYPTYEKNWRYAKPFQLLDSEQDLDTLNDYYYVRLDDLEQVSEMLLQEHAYYVNLLKTDRIARRTAVYDMIRRLDKELYSYGIYCSEDLFYSYHVKRDVLFACIAGGCLLILVMTRKRSRK